MAGQDNLAGAGDWVGLQNRVFTRWVAQKLAVRHLKCADVVAEISDGKLLVNLIEILSETKFSGKMDDAKMDVQKLDNLSRALKYVYEHVNIKIKPSPDDLLKGDQKLILGLVWSIMLRFMKFGDEEEQDMNPKDALQLWVRNKTAGYEGITIQDLTKSFHNGLALCAIIHKHRPKAIGDYAALDPANGLANIQLAMDAAEKYFRLEKYVTPEEVLKLDENSMTVFVGDFYVAIAEARKLDIANRRIGKVIKLTEDNDARRAAYIAKATAWNATQKETLDVLNDRTIDNTLAGARKRLEDLYTYKQTKKGEIMTAQLDLEAQYSDLALILRFNNRPQFTPPAGLALADIEAGVAQLEQAEQDRKAHLHAELNRQIKLVKFNDQHETRYAKIKAFVDEQTAYLSTAESISSVKAAEQAIENLDDYEADSRNIQSGLVVQLKGIGAKLGEEKYENQSKVAGRESEIDAAFANMASLAQKKRATLEADLQREKDKVDQICREFATLAEAHAKWVHDKKEGITTSSASLEEQEAAIAALQASYEADGSKLPALKELNAKFEAMEIYVNPHSLLSYYDLEAQWAQYAIFLEKKLSAVRSELESKRNQGITAEQFAEIDTNFKRFDKDSNGSIDKKELKSCLYSLGEEKTKAEVEQILKDFGNGTRIPPDGFKRFMITILGVSDTKEDILAGFVTINQEKGEEAVMLEKMEMIMSDHDIAYLKQHAQPLAGGLDYKGWTEAAFAR